jgi:hypothetical protein
VDRGDVTLISLWIHVPLATAWVGLVMFDVFASLAPGMEAGQRGRMIVWSRPFVVVAVLLIMVTGVWQTHNNPLLEVNSWSTLEQLRERTYGLALFWKHGFVLATFALTVVVRFMLAPRLVAAPAVEGGGTAPDAARTERVIRWLSLLNLVACTAALVLATLMVYQLH